MVWTDERLDDRFNAIDRRLENVDTLPALVAALTVQVTGLAKEFATFRIETAQDFAVSREDNRQTSRVLLGFLSALLVTMIGSIIAVIIVL